MMQDGQLHGHDLYKVDDLKAGLFQYANKVERDLRELKRRRRELVEKGRSKESVKQVETRINELMLQFNERVGALQK